MNSRSSLMIGKTMREGSATAGAGRWRWKRFACYLPVVALGVEFVWIFLLFMALVISVGDTPYVNTPDKSHLFSWLSAIPAAFGVLFGIVGILLRLPVKIMDWIFLIAGSAGCAGLFYFCTNGLW
jgi:hypothetical protein